VFRSGQFFVGVLDRKGLAAPLTALAIMMLAGCSGGGEGERKRPPPLVKAAEPVNHDFVERIEAVGTARANEQVTLSANVTERIERLLFEDGMTVRGGQVLAILSQQQEQAALAGALAAQRQAAAQLSRVQELSNKGFATAALLDQQRAAASLAESNVREARAQIEDRTLRAPFAGQVSLRTISAGAVVNAGTPLVTISDVSRIKLDFTVPETRLRALRIGQPIQAIAAALPQPFAGQVTSIDPVIDAQSRAVLVRAVLPNPGGRIKPGMLMTVRIEAGRRTVSAVPELAVVGDGGERFVYVVGQDGKARRMPVKTGLRDQGLMEVSGLPLGARVISEGVIKVSDGVAVRVMGDKPPAGGSQRP
jgi:membrane fusion protein, multidrug efflux system